MIVRGPGPGQHAAASADVQPMDEAPFFSRTERFAAVGSTNDIVRGWLADGVPEVCVAVADEQTAGRGRAGRTWVAPPGRGLLLSVGFRPAWLAPDRVWRLAATVSLAMADAAEEVAGLPDGAIRLKWPNDLVVEMGGFEMGGSAAPAHDPAGAEPAPAPATRTARKLGGVLGETDGLGTGDPRAVVGIGVNADWPAAAFPPGLAGTMTSLNDAAGGRPIDRDLLLEEFLSRLEPRILALRDGWFDVAGWTDRQVTTRRRIRLEGPDGRIESCLALGVDALTGALVVADDGAPAGERAILAAEIVSVRLGDPAPASPGPRV